jgi:hypothetical protein
MDRDLAILYPWRMAKTKDNIKKMLLKKAFFNRKPFYIQIYGY